MSVKQSYGVDYFRDVVKADPKRPRGLVEVGGVVYGLMGDHPLVVG